MDRDRVAVVDDEPIVCREIARHLGREDLEVETFLDGASAMERFRQHPFDVVLCDLRLPDHSGLRVLEHIKRRRPDTEVIIITAYSSIETAVEAIQLGAFHYVTKPARAAEIVDLTRRALSKVHLNRRKRDLKAELISQGRLPVIIGESPQMVAVFALLEKVVALNCNVLIQGESGTGKEMVARAIHHRGPRHDMPFIPFHCGSFAEDLAPNELFGHEKGAYTGATERKIGLLEAGHQGTVFLDEIGTMPPSMQIKLLRFVQERSLLRVGGVEPIELDVRLIAASNLDLLRAVKEGVFRQDLYYRLNVVCIELPPLRARRQDIPLLANHFLQEYRDAFGKPVTGIDPETLEILVHYPFPGNVRELENIIERAVVIGDGSTIRPQDLPPDLQKLSISSLDEQGWVSLEEKEREYIQQVLIKTRYNRKEAAAVLKISRTTLWRKMKQLGLE